MFDAEYGVRYGHGCNFGERAMLLVVLFNCVGAGAVVFGVYMLTLGDFGVLSFVSALPVFGTALVAFGLGQVVHALLRTADASEAAARHMKAGEEHLHYLAARFDQVAARIGLPKEATAAVPRPDEVKKAAGAARRPSPPLSDEMAERIR